LFRQRVNATKYMPAAQQAQYREACEGTSFLPRDFLLMQMYGRLFAGVLPDGKVMYSMASRQTLSESLDILSQTPGTILFRGPDYWQPLPVGTPGQMLAVAPDGTSFEWINPSAGIGIFAAASFHWNGSTIVIEGSENVATITRISAGIYEITLSVAAHDNQYLVLGGGRWPTDPDPTNVVVCLNRGMAPTTTKFRLQTGNAGNFVADAGQVFFIVIEN
jgi:hypothetical protein